MEKFCVITTQRSGSTWLVDLLNKHAEVRAFSEIFLNKPREVKPWNANLLPPIRFYEFRRSDDINWLLRPFLTFKYLNLLNGFSEGKPLVGFKIMYNQLKRYPEVLLKLILDRYKLIHLVRTNYLDVLISAEYRMQKGRQHATTDSAMEKIRIDPSQLIAELRRREKETRFMRRFLTKLSLPLFEVTYENLKSDHNLTLNSIARFLSIGENFSADVNSSLKRLNRGRHFEKIINYDEIRQVLEGTDFFEMLDKPK